MALPLKPVLLAAAATMLVGIAPATTPSAETLDQLDPTRALRQLCGARDGQGKLLRDRLKIAAAYGAAHAAPTGIVKLMPGLGSQSFPITTQNPLAQRYFDQGLMLSYNFNHAEAIRAFREAQRLDPGCAMCWWGEAFAQGPNINAPMDAAVVAPAFAAARKAETLKGRTSPEEQALIGALQLRYGQNTGPDRGALDMAYAEAMLDVAKRFPANDDIAVLAAEAVMDTRPWDYWETDRMTPKGRIGDAVRLVETVIARSPNHPQAAHLYIHLMEATAKPGRAEAAADRLATPLAPKAGHLVHMPGHLYYVVGRYKDSIRVNVDAARVDEAYLKTSGERGLYRFGYYPHNVHFIVTSAQMAGDMKTAITESQRLHKILNTDLSATMPWVQPVDAAPYFAYAQFAEPKQVLALPPPDARLPYATAIWHYARAVAHAQRKDDRAAETEIAAIAKIRTTTDFKPMTDQLVPAPDLLMIAETVARARLSYAHGRYAEAATLYRQAIAIEDRLNYYEPPWWYYPVRQSLGAALYRAGDMAGARQAFTEALAKTPNNGWALFGLAAAQTAAGDRLGAAATRAALSRAWMGNPAWLKIDRL